MIKTTKQYIFLLSVVLFGFLFLMPTSDAMAQSLPGNVPIGEGYFSGINFGDGIAADLIQSCNGSDPFDGSMTSKSKFIDTVMNYYKGSCSKKGSNSKMAEFLIQSMQWTRDPVDSNYLQSWEEFIKDENLKIDWKMHNYQINSTLKSSGSAKDAVFVNYPGSRMSLIFTYRGEVVYAIKGDCGNSVGYPARVWLAYPRIKSNLSIAQPNQQIIWTHWAQMLYGSNIKPVSVQAKQTWTGGKTITGPSLATGSRFPQTSSSFTSTYTPTLTDVGKTFCSQTLVNPFYFIGNSYYGPSSGNLAEACVKVVYNKPTEKDPCRPIEIYAEPRNYDITISAPNSSPKFLKQDRPIRAITKYINWGLYSKKTLLPNPEFTRLHTTGENLTVDFREVNNHVTGTVDNYEPIYDWVPRETICQPDIYDPLTGKMRPGPCTDPEWKEVGKRYVNTTITYSDGSTTIYPTVLYNTNGGSWSTAFGPCYDYALTGSLNNFGSRKEAEESISVNPSISSAPFTRDSDKWAGFWGEYQTHSKSKSTYWQITLMKVPVNVAPPSAVPATDKNGSGASPCSYFDPNSISSCSVAQSGNQVFGKEGGSIGAGYSVPDFFAGTKLCYAFSLYPNQSDPANTSHSPDPTNKWFHASYNPATNCVIVVKKPKIQIWGGDVRAGNKELTSSVSATGNILTSTSNKFGKQFGSWSEYGILATGFVRGMASGSATAYGGGSGTCTNSQLSFANRPNNSSVCSGSIGSYVFSSPSRSFSSYFPTNNLTPKVNGTVDIAKLKDGIYTSDASSLNISGGNVNGSIVLNVPNTTVTISGDIFYPEKEYQAIGEIPQLVIIAKNINVQGGVRNIDSWLIAQDGNIQTCSDVAPDSALSVNICNRQLQVNGPVNAGKIILKRTYGSDPGAASDEPAEIFNLRADTYLWIYANSLKDNRLIGTYVTELPPRL